MGRYTGPQCRQCRAEETKLFLKGDRCYTDKCAFERRPYAPGQQGQRRRKVSDYGLQLREKQRAKQMYGVLERQFRRYFEMADRMKGATGDNLLVLLERRLDNMVYRMGFARSRSQARQLVKHGHFRVNSLVYNAPTIERLLKTFPSRSLGLTYDPSHLVSRMIDYIDVLRKFSERIYHVHAKDAEILYDVLRIFGAFDPEGVIWWRFRVPGWGEVDWQELITALYELNYNLGFSVEIEDPIFQGEEGFAKAIEYLKPLWCLTYGASDK